MCKHCRQRKSLEVGELQGLSLKGRPNCSRSYKYKISTSPEIEAFFKDRSVMLQNASPNSNKSSECLVCQHRDHKIDLVTIKTRVLYKGCLEIDSVRSRTFICIKATHKVHISYKQFTLDVP